MGDDGVKKMMEMSDSLDVPGLKNLLNFLWRQCNFFKKTLDMIRDSVVVIKPDGEIFYCNRSARELLGIVDGKQTKILWKYIPEFIVLTDFTKSCSRGSESFLSKEIRISYPRKSILNVTMTYCDDETDGLFVLRISDITEARATSEKAINDEKLSSIVLLAGSVAHEIGNPLNSISLKLQLMQRQISKLGNPDKSHEFESSLNVCLDEIARLDGIIKNFLHAIRPTHPKMEDVHLDSLIKESVDVMDAEFCSLNVRVFCNIDVLPVILGDPAQIKQVFFNVLKNACEAASTDGTIFIDGAATDDSVIMTFSDNGVGMTCDAAYRVFQPYYSTKKNGSGLGMMIVERILREHGATIDIASAHGVGTKITISFPRKDKRVPLIG